LPHEEQLAARVIATISDRVTEVLPAFGQAKIDRVWSGLLDITPDGLPVIERTSEVDGLVIAAGFSGHGFCLGPMTGQFICELATEKQPALPLQPFRRGRFTDVTGSQEAEHESSQRDRGG
jgi:sarcosine oxidase subunit beta